MLLFGEEPLYLSHLPMFQSPHNFQMLLEVGFDDAALQALRADREGGGDLYTFEPEKFPISELDPGGDGPTRTSMAGTVFHGHFERGGTPIARATAQIRNVVYFAELDVQATQDEPGGSTWRTRSPPAPTSTRCSPPGWSPAQ
jgi:hypothetical protein